MGPWFAINEYRSAPIWVSMLESWPCDQSHDQSSSNPPHHPHGWLAQGEIVSPGATRGARVALHTVREPERGITTSNASTQPLSYPTLGKSTRLILIFGAFNSSRSTTIGDYSITDSYLGVMSHEIEWRTCS